MHFLSTKQIFQSELTVDVYVTALAKAQVAILGKG